jgi:hypothetical protein
MRYIFAIGTLIVLLVISGCTLFPTGYVVFNPEEQPKLVDNKTSEQPQKEESLPVEYEEKEPTIIPEFRDIDYSYLGAKIMFEGYLFDKETDKPMDAEIEIFCHGEKEYDTKTGSDGKFFISIGSCSAGEKAWAEVEYNGKRYKSDSIMVPKIIIGTGASSSTQSIKPSSGREVIPEFTSIGAGIAMLGALAYYRYKRSN